eukprot:TRINITY_DN1617_c0_g1_i1.p1 TRINITY_DN1617_c0_g1~~TRINITY_DN1617_c0_g1_i1.p1  ORF type:complete len:226 (+),score=27.09 TRINITY_DN1617_c0_g1_i1:56-679(+)
MEEMPAPGYLYYGSRALVRLCVLVLTQRLPDPLVTRIVALVAHPVPQAAVVVRELNENHRQVGHSLRGTGPGISFLDYVINPGAGLHALIVLVKQATTNPGICVSSFLTSHNESVHGACRRSGLVWVQAGVAAQGHYMKLSNRAEFRSNDVIGFLVDRMAGKLHCFLNGSTVMTFSEDLVFPDPEETFKFGLQACQHDELLLLAIPE